MDYKKECQELSKVVFANKLDRSIYADIKLASIGLWAFNQEIDLKEIMERYDISERTVTQYIEDFKLYCTTKDLEDLKLRDKRHKSTKLSLRSSTSDFDITENELKEMIETSPLELEYFLPYWTPQLLKYHLRTKSPYLDDKRARVIIDKIVGYNKQLTNTEYQELKSESLDIWKIDLYQRSYEYRNPKLESNFTIKYYFMVAINERTKDLKFKYSATIINDKEMGIGFRDLFGEILKGNSKKVIVILRDTKDNKRILSAVEKTKSSKWNPFLGVHFMQTNEPIFNDFEHFKRIVDNNHRMFINSKNIKLQQYQNPQRTLLTKMKNEMQHVFE